MPGGRWQWLKLLEKCTLILMQIDTHALTQQPTGDEKWPSSQDNEIVVVPHQGQCAPPPLVTWEAHSEFCNGVLYTVLCCCIIPGAIIGGF